MASIAREGKSWVVRWRDRRKVQRKRSFSRKPDAVRYRTKIENEKLEGGLANPHIGKALMRDIVKQWKSQLLHLKPSTKSRYLQISRDHIEPFFNQMAVAEVVRSDVAEFVAERAGSVSPSTVQQEFHVLSTVFDVAIADQRIPRNPCVGVNLPPVVKGDPIALTWDQVELLADEMDTRHDDVLILAATGLRFAEFVGLTVGSVRSDRRLRVNGQLVEIEGEMVRSTPKNGKNRTVPVPESLWHMVEMRTHGRSSDDYLFTSPLGAVIRRRNWARAFRKARENTGLDYNPHVLRHTAASLAIKSGASVKDVQALLGHASAVTTLDTYAAWFDDDLEDLRQKLDSVIEP